MTWAGAIAIIFVAVLFLVIGLAVGFMWGVMTAGSNAPKINEMVKTLDLRRRKN